MQTIIVVYIVVVNVVTLVMFGVDKWRANRQQYRISERQLYIMMWLGGVIWAALGMQIFRHKTIKWPFLMRFVGITLARVIILVLTQIL